MASERDLERLDDYLRNKLSPQDKSAFERALEGDPSLQKRLQVERHIVEGMRKARVAELKQMLNNVPVTATPGGTSLLAKVGAWIVLAGLAGGGAYIYLNNENESAAESGISAPLETPEDTRKQTPPVIEHIQPPIAKRDATQEQVEEKVPATTAEPKTEPKTEATPNVVPEHVAESAKTQEPIASAVDSGKGLAGIVSTPSIPIEAGINGNNGKYTFHYQFKDDKLYLYGVFEKDLYELLEFSSNNKRTLFLSYKDKYYHLQDEDTKVKRLTPVNDAALVKRLKDYRAAN